MASYLEVAPGSLTRDLLQLLRHKLVPNTTKSKRSTIVAKWQANATRSCQHTFDFHDGNKSLASAVQRHLDVARSMAVGINQDACPSRRMKNGRITMHF